MIFCQYGIEQIKNEANMNYLLLQKKFWQQDDMVNKNGLYNDVYFALSGICRNISSTFQIDKRWNFVHIGLSTKKWINFLNNKEPIDMH